MSFSRFLQGGLYISCYSSTRSAKPEQFARGRILLVIPRAGLPAHSFDRILKEQGGKARKIGQSDIYIVKVPEMNEERVVEVLLRNPHIKSAELDYDRLTDPFVSKACKGYQQTTSS